MAVKVAAATERVGDRRILKVARDELFEEKRFSICRFFVTRHMALITFPR
jgi:hypothetical protein